MKLGSYTIESALIAAPMAGVTDRAFRQLVRRLGADFAVSEMVSSDPSLRQTRKSQTRLNHRDEVGPRWVQIAGADPRWMADAAKYNQDLGAQLIDINMGCPAKKVCNRAAGSALLQDEGLVRVILEAVVAAVDIPVTLKIRTGPSPETRNGVSIAKIAAGSGVQLLSVHGRSRACAFRGQAEYDTVRAIKAAVDIPIVANGDINSPAEAATVLRYTDADGLMIGRGAQGNPWIFREIAAFLATGNEIAAPSLAEQRDVLLTHLEGLYELYGERQGVRIARKHLSWYCKAKPGYAAFWASVNCLESATEQRLVLERYFDALTDAQASNLERLAA